MFKYLIGFAVGCLVVYFPMELTMRQLEKRIQQLIKDRNHMTLERYMRKLGGGDD